MLCHYNSYVLTFLSLSLTHVNRIDTSAQRTWMEHEKRNDFVVSIAIMNCEFHKADLQSLMELFFCAEFIFSDTWSHYKVVFY